MKKIVYIVVAAIMAVVVGLWVGNSIDVLNKQAKALEENAEVIQAVSNHVLGDRLEEEQSYSESTEEPPVIVEVVEVQTASASVTVEPEVEERTAFDKSVVEETAFKLANSLSLGNENEKIEGYANKKEFIKEYFMPFMGVNMAHFFADDFFYEREDGVYIQGMFSPHLLDPERNFEISQVDTDYYEATQTIEKLHPLDASTITYHYEYDSVDNDWDIWSITYDY